MRWDTPEILPCSVDWCEPLATPSTEWFLRDPVLLPNRWRCHRGSQPIPKVFWKNISSCKVVLAHSPHVLMIQVWMGNDVRVYLVMCKIKNQLWLFLTFLAKVGFQWEIMSGFILQNLESTLAIFNLFVYPSGHAANDPVLPGFLLWKRVFWGSQAGRVQLPHGWRLHRVCLSGKETQFVQVVAVGL